MLRINRLRVEINTVNGVYGIDTSFSSGLNFISGRVATQGVRCHRQGTPVAAIAFP